MSFGVCFGGLGASACDCAFFSWLLNSRIPFYNVYELLCSWSDNPDNVSTMLFIFFFYKSLKALSYSSTSVNNYVVFALFPSFFEVIAIFSYYQCSIGKPIQQASLYFLLPLPFFSLTKPLF